MNKYLANYVTDWLATLSTREIRDSEKEFCEWDSWKSNERATGTITAKSFYLL